MAAGEVKKVRLRFVVLIHRILALFLCHQSRVQSFAYCFIGVWNSFTQRIMPSPEAFLKIMTEREARDH